MARGLLGIAAAAALLALGVAWLVASAGPPDGPVDVAWDRTPCARCRMLVSDPRFAAQLHTPGGQVLHFDDPGCLWKSLAEASEAPHAVYYRNAEADGWLAADRAIFVPMGPTPMGYGFGAVAAGAAAGRGLAREEAMQAIAAARGGTE